MNIVISVMKLRGMSRCRTENILHRPGMIRLPYVSVVGGAERDNLHIVVYFALWYRLWFEDTLIIGANISCSRREFELHFRRTIQRAGIRVAGAGAIIAAIEA